MILNYNYLARAHLYTVGVHPITSVVHNQFPPFSGFSGCNHYYPPSKAEKTRCCLEPVFSSSNASPNSRITTHIIAESRQMQEERANTTSNLLKSD